MGKIVDSSAFVEEATQEPAVEAPVSVAPVVPVESTEVTSTPEAVKSNKSGMMKMARIAVELILLVAVVYLSLWGMGLQSKNKDLNNQITTLNNNPVIAEQKKANQLVSKVSALMTVPTGETPQAAQVTDPAALKTQYAFFTDVQKGDQILFYVKAGKVIVYRPSTNKIVQTGPLTVNAAPAATTTTKKSNN